MATVTEHEGQQVERANASGLTPVVFIHGLWLLPSSWDRWAELFAEAGFGGFGAGDSSVFFGGNSCSVSRMRTSSSRSSRAAGAIEIT